MKKPVKKFKKRLAKPGFGNHLWLLLLLLVPACGPYGACPAGPGWGGRMMDWGWGGGGIMGLAITAIIVGILIYFVLSRKEISPGGPGENALDILKKRYARGEISKEEFEQMKKDLES